MKSSIQIGRCAVALVLLAGTAGVHAVTRKDGGIGNPTDFPCSVKITDPTGLCTGTVIGNGKFVITAKHCITNGTAGSGYTLSADGGASFTGTGTVMIHPTADIAIIPVNGMFMDSYALYCDRDELNMQVCFAGYGRSSATPGGGMEEIPSGTKRAGYNVIDNIAGDRLRFTFNLNAGLGNSEATTNAGDSGMGYFKLVGTQYQLVGVHSGILGGVNLDGTVSEGTRVSDYKDWINMNIPAPSGAVPLLAAFLFAAPRRRPI